MRPPWVILSNKALRALYADLRQGDLILGMLAIKREEEYLFTDLLARGIQGYPPLLSQALARSKCFQAFVFREFMVPLTLVIRDRHDLIRAVNKYGERGIGPVITKQDRFNCGLGIHYWDHIENLYNQATLGQIPYPFVLQPFVAKALDIRVIILGDYEEAYTRRNPYNFRNNIFFGGEAKRYDLSEEERSLCHKIMQRGQFPYAHIDLMVTPEGEVYLGEVNLRGGLKGAQIQTLVYQNKLEAMQQAFLEAWLARYPEAELKS